MATLAKATTQFGSFNPISSALANLPNGAGTIAVIARAPGNTTIDTAGLVNSGLTEWYHALYSVASSGLSDDDGLVIIQEQPTWSPGTAWYIHVVTWPAGGAALNRFHHINLDTPAGWTHSPSSANNGGNRAGPTTAAGVWRIGYFGDGAGSAEIALCAAWAGTALSDAQCAELSVNSRTSDWWNNSAGDPTLLIECTTLTPTDIGLNPSTFSSIGSLTLTGANPTWTFDGRGAAVAADNLRSLNPIPFMSNQRI